MSDNENDYNSDSEYDPYVDDVDYDEDDQDEDFEEYYDDQDGVTQTDSRQTPLPGQLSLVDRMANERFVEKCTMYEGGLTAELLSFYEVIELINLLTQTLENGRPHNCDISLSKWKDNTTFDVAINEIKQKRCEYLIRRELFGGNYELIDPNNCTFNEQDVRDQYLHNTKKSFD
jgi:hypothetical protein